MTAAPPAPPSAAVLSSCHSGAQAIVHVEKPGRPPVVVDDKERGDRGAVHQPQRLGGEMPGGDRPWLAVHDLADPADEERVIHVAAQIAVGDDAEEPSVAAGDADAAKAF